MKIKALVSSNNLYNFLLVDKWESEKEMRNLNTKRMQNIEDKTCSRN